MKKIYFISVIALGALVISCKDGKPGGQPTSTSQELREKGSKGQTNVETPETQAKSDGQEAQPAPATEQPTAATASSSAQPMVYSVSADGFLNIREHPNSSSKILGRLLTDGKGAEYLGSTGNWHNVRYEGVVGFVHAGYARLEGLEQQAQRAQTSGRKVYYVVLNSFSDLNSAKEATRYLPDALDGSCIFRATQGGKTVYRLCEGSYYKRSDAQSQLDAIKQYLEREAWIWEADAVAPCVYQGVYPSGESASVLPR